MDMTFRELQLYSEGQNERLLEEWRQQVTIAHLTASLSRIPLPQKRGQPDKFPKLEKLLSGINRRKETPAEKAKRIRAYVMSRARPGEITLGRKKRKK